MYENYAAIRDKKGLSDYQIAKDLGISRSIFSDWKSGRHKPSKKNRLMISGYLGLPPTENFEFDSEELYKTDKLSPRTAVQKRITGYMMRLSDGRVCELTSDEYNELETATNIFIDSWIKSQKLMK